MARISGRLLKLEVDGADKSDQVSRGVITSGEADSDFVSFADAAAGGAREYKLTLTMVQDPATGSLWSEMFDNPGDEVPFTLAVHGNATPSPSQPHFEGTAIISEPDGDFIGGEASTSNGPLTVEVEWVLTGKPTKVTA